jgi:hypothetical protein
MSTRAGVALVWLCALSPACAFDAGQGFATLEDGEISAVLEITAGRRVAPDTLRTDMGYEVKVTRLSVRVRDIELQELQSSAGGDETSVCPDGHCHEDETTPPATVDNTSASRWVARWMRSKATKWC